MELIIAIILIILGFSALVTYSFWYLFIGPEALFSVPDFADLWQSLTQTRTFMPAQGTPYTHDDACRGLKKRLAELEERAQVLLTELQLKYDSNKLRELNIVCNHIDVTEARLNGTYNHD